MTQFEFYKSFQFVLELLLAEAMFVFRLQRRKRFVLRLAAALAALFLFSWLLPAIPNAFYCSFLFLIIFVATVFALSFMFKATALTVTFCCVAGYTTQHLAYELYMLMLNVTGMRSNAPMGFYGTDYIGVFSNAFLTAVYFSIYVLTYFVCFFTFSERLNGVEKVKLKNMSIFVLSVFIFIIDILVNSLLVFYTTEVSNLLYYIVEGYNILCCFIALYFQFSVLSESQAKESLKIVKQMWSQAKEQYAASKANLDMLNMRYHDMKHLLNILSDLKVANSAITEDIEKRMVVYNAQARTGNSALDVVLTEKSFVCGRNGIKLSCIADGTLLDFMSEEDIYVLFGNMLDNAIEAVMKLEEKKRVISLTIRRKNDFIIIKEINYYSDEIVFEDGFPKTTKEEEFHGFGIKSIHYICERYRGELLINAQDETFTLSLVFGETRKETDINE